MLEEVLEYEEIGRRFKINGHYYNLNFKSKTGNKYYMCIKRRRGLKCRGSITITPNLKILKKVGHTCNENHQSTTEYEKVGRKTKIDGNFYYLVNESKTKNKHYKCVKKKTTKCRGSMTITPNSKIIKKVDHTCNLVPS